MYALELLTKMQKKELYINCPLSNCHCLKLKNATAYGVGIATATTVKDSLVSL